MSGKDFSNFFAKGPPPWQRSLRRAVKTVVALLLAGAVAVVISMATAKVPPAPAKERAKPALTTPPSTPPSTPPKVEVCWARYSSGETSGLLATGGFPSELTWRTTCSGLLIRHPQGQLLVDTGTSRHTRDELAGQPWFPRTLIKATLDSDTVDVGIVDALARLGIGDPRTLRWLVPTHGHFDHLGGMMDVPSVPVLLSADELGFIQSARAQRRLVLPAHAKALLGRAEELKLTATRYETFDESADLFGDGTVVVVRLPGHTPGHVGVFVNVSPQLRLFYVGDAVDVLRGVEQRLPKSLILRYTDDDPALAADTIAKLAQLHQAAPELVMLPAHDEDAWRRAFGEPYNCVSAP